MNKNNQLIPKFRFPEFVNEGEWVEKTLGKLAKKISERNKDSLVKNVFTNSAVNGIVDQRDYFDKDIADKNNLENYYIVKEEDYVYNPRISNIAPVGPISKNKTNKKGVMSPLYTVFRFGSKNNDFFEYYFKSVHWYDSIKRVANMGARFDRISISDTAFMEIPVLFPSPPEQQKIASTLSSLDDLIAAHSEKLTLLQTHKKGLMQNLFPQAGETVPKLRFPEFEGEGEWVEKKLGELIEIKGRIGYRGYTLADIVNKGEGAISMSPSNINEFGTLNFSKSTYITWAKYEESPEIMLQNDYTVLVKTGSTFGKVAYIKNLNEKTTINPQLVVLKPTKINSFFLYLLVANTSVQEQINATVVGGAIPTLSQDSISKFKIIIPKDQEQKKIATCLSSLDTLITAQSERIAQLKAHKKGLMQGLFPKIKD